MKKNILLFLAVSIILVGCSKSDDKPQNCDISINAIVGTYKITRIISVDAGISTDITDSYLDACEKTATYELRADESVNYIESAPGCTGSYATGYWHLLGGGKINFDSGALAILNVDISNYCSYIVISGANGGPTYTFTFTRL